MRSLAHPLGSSDWSRNPVESTLIIHLLFSHSSHLCCCYHTQSHCHLSSELLQKSLHCSPASTLSSCALTLTQSSWSKESAGEWGSGTLCDQGFFLECWTWTKIGPRCWLPKSVTRYYRTACFKLVKYVVHKYIFKDSLRKKKRKKRTVKCRSFYHICKITS